MWGAGVGCPVSAGILLAMPLCAFPWWWASRVFSWLSFYGRSNEFYAGLISTANVLYYLSFCGVLLFVTIQVIDRRRWSEG